jgi:hypothetical protein
LRNDFNNKSSIDYDNYWYDIYEDWELIEASFLQQYNIRLRTINDLPYEEFVIYLSGLLPETPLGNIVAIRSENNRDTLKHFTPQQKKIRSDWRKYLNELASQDEEYVKRKTEQLTKAFEQAFG